MMGKNRRYGRLLSHKTIGLFCLVVFLTSVRADPVPKPVFQYGFAIFGALKYPPDFFCFDYVNPKAPRQGTFVLSSLRQLDSLNPYLLKGEAAEGLSFLEGNFLHASLFKKSADEPFSSYGYLAEGIHVSEDGKRVTFALRPKAVFHDGSPVLPEDVIFTFTYLCEKGSPFYKSYYKAVEKVEKTGPRWVTFILKDGSSPEMPSILGQLPVLPRQFYQGPQGEKANLVPPLGSGPYKIAKVEAGKAITYERVSGWWGDQVPAVRGFYHFQNIRYDYYRDTSISFEALKKGQIDFQNLSSKQGVILKNFSAVKEGKLILKDIPHQVPVGHIGFVFNIRKPLFQDSRVRQALGMVFDFPWVNKNLMENLRQRITSYFTHSEFEANGFITPEEVAILAPFKKELSPQVFEKPMSFFVDADLPDLRQRKRLALDLLRQAGWILEKGKLIDAKTRKPFRFTFFLIAGTAWDKIISHYQEALKNHLGVDMDIRLVDAANYESSIKKFDFDMVLDLIPGSYNPGNELRDHFGSRQASIPGSKNLMGIQSPVVDTLVQSIVTAKSYETLRLYTNALDRVLMSGYYSVPAFFPPTFRVAYWKKIKMPKVLPKLTGYDPMTFWIEESSLK